MKLLLDTHVLLWAVVEPEALSESVRSALADPENTLLVSSATAWEIATKHRIGRLPQAADLIANLGSYVEALGAVELPITIRHAQTAGLFRTEHRDPFDRMLAAQAVLEGLTLLTSDPAFSAFPAATMW